MLACSCLNIIIIYRGSLSEIINKESLSLTKEESNDPFFKQEIQQVSMLNNISKVQPGLVESRNVGSWSIYYCINCSTHTHAVHQEKGASCVLVFSKLLSQNRVDNLRNSDSFSKVYGIIIDTNDFDEDIIPEQHFIPEVESTIKAIKETLSEMLKKESAAVERRIKKFTEEQYLLLEAFREKAFNEQQQLITEILNHNKIRQTLEVINDDKKPEFKNDGSPIKTKNYIQLENAINLTPLRHTPKRQKSSSGGVRGNSFDTEGLFECEGLADSTSDLEIDDSDEEDDGVFKIDKASGFNRTRSSSVNIAKSLPMSIPAFLPQLSHDRGDLDDDLPPENNVDIAASIKKLAQSVHGEAVFGDLPKPRFSKQL